jgi:ornithine cyclodeaminase/alanine dehydrogenase-like protein (mu-crystallin family)
MSDAPIVWITGSDVSELVSLEDAIEALEEGLALEGTGDAKNVTKTIGMWGDGNSMHALGSMFPAAGYVGFKTWANTKHGAGAIFELFDAETGALLAVIEAGLLGQLRTSGISGLATRWMAKPDASEMALIGTGRSALMQVVAIAAVRPLKRLRVYSPTEEHRKAFAANAASLFAFDVVEAPTLRDATRGAEIVTIMTRAREPFFSASDLDRGSHLNAVGAILPKFAEFHQDVFDRASMVVVDHIPNAKVASREFREHYDGGHGSWDAVKELSAVIASKTTRPPDADVTLFKALGMGISDLSVAKMVYERARAKGIGLEIPKPKRVQARWRSGRKAATV